MKILITGARGFIGSHLGNRLAALGHDVYGIDDDSNPSGNKLDFFCETGDVSIHTGTAITAFDVIFHLAASINVDESIEAPGKYFLNNAGKTMELLEAMRANEFKGKFIYASSAEVYGNAQTPLMSEEHPLDPVSPYAASKLAAEQFCKNYAQLYGLNITIIRNFNTFGDYQRGGIYGGVIAKFKTQARNGEALTVYGSGEQARDYMHISQAVDGYILAMEHNLPLIVNFGSGTPIKIIDIANFISSKFNVPVTHTRSRPNEIMMLRADISRVQRYGYKVATDFWHNLDEYLSHAF